MSDDLQITSALTVPRSELMWRFSRSGGPGGQSVNTTDSRVELSFDLARTESIPEELKARALRRLRQRLTDGVITVAASEQRSQLQNRRAAMARLAEILADGIRPPAKPRRPTKPSRGAVETRLDEKRRRGQLKETRRPPE